MSFEDQEKWNERYATGAYIARPHPTRLLEQWIDQLPNGRALDLACGAGRNSLFLADHGYDTVGIDISDIAIERAKNNATQDQRVAFQTADLDLGLPSLGTFDLIIAIRFVDLALFATLPELLNNNGVLVTEQHMEVAENRPVAGPADPRFRVAPEKLRSTFQSLDRLYQFEGFIVDVLGEESALTQFIGKKRYRSF